MRFKQFMYMFGIAVLCACVLWAGCCVCIVYGTPIAYKAANWTLQVLNLDTTEESETSAESMPLLSWDSKLESMLQEYDQQLATLEENKWGLLYYFDEYHVRLETTGEFRETEDAEPLPVDVTLEMHLGGFDEEAGSFLVFDVTDPSNYDEKITDYRKAGTYAISFKGKNDANWDDTYEVVCTDALTFRCEKYSFDDNIANMLCRNNTIEVELYGVNAKSGRSVLTFTIPCNNFTGVWERYKSAVTEIVDKS